MGLELDLFRPEDGPACEAIGGDVFRGINIPYILEREYGITGHGSRMNAYWTRGLFESRPETFLVARDDGKVVGFSGLMVQPQLGWGWLMHIGVAQSAQGRGIGRRLVEASLDVFRGMDLPIAWIEYDRGNERAGGLYRRLGFQDFGQVLYYHGPVAVEDRAEVCPVSSLEALLSALAGVEAPLFPEEALASLHDLPAGPAQARAACLSLRLAAAGAYAPCDGSQAYALAHEEGGGVVAHFPFFWAAAAAGGAILLRALPAACTGQSRPLAAYAELYEPAPTTRAALAAAGFREGHGLTCLSRVL